MDKPSTSLNLHYLLRKLHSLTGIVPIGGFLVFHLWENSLSRKGASYYNTNVVEFINNMNYVRFMEILFIALPIAFHALYGMVIWYYGKSNVCKYRYFRNFMYYVQRLTGIVALAFICYHVSTTRIAGIFEPEIHNNLHAHMVTTLSNPLIFAVYLIGVISASIHFTYGVWLFLINWGITPSVKSQKRSSLACFGVCALLIAIGVHGLLGFFIK